MTVDEIVYVTSRWGEPSQTFVRREANAVRAANVAVTAVSLKRPGRERGGIDPVWLSSPQVVLGVLVAAIRRPRQVATVFGSIIRSRLSPSHLVAHLVAAAIGVAWVGRRRLPPGHLHSHFGWVAATATWAAAVLDDRTFSVMLHAFEIHDEDRRDRFTPIPLRAAARLFTISEGDRAIISDRWGVDPVVQHISVDDSWLEPPDEERDPDLVASVGRLTEKKGFEVLLDGLAAGPPSWRCEIVGDGPLADDLRARIDRLGLGDRVRLVGPLPEDGVRRTLQRAAVMCLACVETGSGDRDGTPTVIVEAMACGAAVLTTDVGAIAEQVGDAGIVVPQRDPAALADGLSRLVDPDLREHLSGAGRRRVADGWVASAVARRLVEVLRGSPVSRAGS